MPWFCIAMVFYLVNQQSLHLNFIKKKSSLLFPPIWTNFALFLFTRIYPTTIYIICLK